MEQTHPMVELKWHAKVDAFFTRQEVRRFVFPVLIKKF